MSLVNFRGLMSALIFLGLLTPQAVSGEEVRGECYEFLFQDSDFSLVQVEEFATMAEQRCRELANALGLSPQGPIRVYLKPGEGISSTVAHRNKAIDLFFAMPIKGIEAPLVHETTHILLDSPHPVLREGMATAMEQSLGTLRTHPTYGASLEEWIAALRCSGRLLPMEELERLDWQGGGWEINLVAYNQSGSFLSYLMESYGLEEVIYTLKWTQRRGLMPLERISQARFQLPLKELEALWLQSLESRGETALARELCSALVQGNLKNFLGKNLSSK